MLVSIWSDNFEPLLHWHMSGPLRLPYYSVIIFLGVSAIAAMVQAIKRHGQDFLRDRKPWGFAIAAVCFASLNDIVRVGLAVLDLVLSNILEMILHLLP